MALVKVLNKYFKVVSGAWIKFFVLNHAEIMLGITTVFYPLFKISYLCFIRYEILGLNSVKV